jgi:hypothetical protein
MRTCLQCGAYIGESGSYCRAHRPKRNVRARGGGAAILAFRVAVGNAAGWRCEVVEDGERCPEQRRDQLQAHHVGGVSSHNDPRRGVLVCLSHHLAVERAERKVRAALAESRKLAS